MPRTKPADVHIPRLFFFTTFVQPGSTSVSFSPFSVLIASSAATLPAGSTHLQLAGLSFSVFNTNLHTQTSFTQELCCAFQIEEPLKRITLHQCVCLFCGVVASTLSGFTPIFRHKFHKYPNSSSVVPCGCRGIAVPTSWC